MRASLVVACILASTAFAQRVPWVVETSTVPSTRTGDPTFLFRPGVGAGTQLIVGTDTAQQGIFLWPPGGLPTVLPVGLVNAADSRGEVMVVTSPLTNSLLVYRLVDAGMLQQFDTGSFNVPSPNQVALSATSDGGFEVWVDTSSNVIQHYAMTLAGTAAAFTTLAPISVQDQPSGLAVDDRTGRLYVAQPSRGILTVERNGAASYLLSIDAGTLGATIGGIDLFPAADGGALLFSAAPNEGEVRVHSHTGTFLTALRFGDVDGGSATLGQPRFLDVFEQPLPGFPRGVLVVQDELMANYKLVSLATVNAVFPIPPPAVPAMVGDGGTDAGTADAGSPDGGSLDAGLTDGGGGGGSGTGGGSGSSGGPPPSVEPQQPSCGCTGGPFAVLPALLMLWWIRRLRRP